MTEKQLLVKELFTLIVTNTDKLAKPLTVTDMYISDEDWGNFQEIVNVVYSAETDDFLELMKLTGRNPKSDLRGADLRGVSFVNADLSNCDLSYADLSGCDLTGANLTNTNLTGANLEGTLLPRNE